MIPKIGIRFSAFATHASAGKGRPGKIRLDDKAPGFEFFRL